MEDGVMAMEFLSLPHLKLMPQLMPGMDTMAMAVDTMADITVDTTDILTAMATDTGAKFNKHRFLNNA